jgi:hypothetical protein
VFEEMVHTTSRFDDDHLYNIHATAGSGNNAGSGSHVGITYLFR